jgi:hypothetical protein
MKRLRLKAGIHLRLMIDLGSFVRDSRSDLKEARSG